MMKSVFDFALSLFSAAILSACGNPAAENNISQPQDLQMTQTSSQSAEISSNTTDLDENTEILNIQIGDTILTAVLENNSSVEALKELLADGEITINVENYGGFEKVGALPESLPQNDKQITAVPGDIMLYQGNSIVIFYGTNSWSYTKLGTISNLSREELREVLSGNDKTISLEISQSLK